VKDDSAVLLLRCVDEVSNKGAAFRAERARISADAGVLGAMGDIGVAAFIAVRRCGVASMSTPTPWDGTDAFAGTSGSDLKDAQS
jgi:hypothetical protein